MKLSEQATEMVYIKYYRPCRFKSKFLISQLKKVDLYILSICKKNIEIKEKNIWLDENAPYFKKENRIIISKEKEKNESSKYLKYKYLKEYTKEKKKIIVIDDDNEILKYLHNNLKEIVLFQDSSLID